MSYNNVNVNVSGPVQPTSTYKTKVLKGNHSFASQVTEANMKYVIKYDFDLNGGSVTIPKNCVLEFDGGSLSNGELILNNTEITDNAILFCNVSGTIKNSVVNILWFGISSNSSEDCSVAFGRIQQLDLGNHYEGTTVGQKTLYIPSGIYHFSNPAIIPELWRSVNIKGDNHSTKLYFDLSSAINGFVVKAYEVRISNIEFFGKYDSDTVLRDFSAIVLDRTTGLDDTDDEHMNNDSLVTECAFINFYRGINIVGRQVKVKDCGFSKCFIGVEINRSIAFDSYQGGAGRGYVISRCHFHAMYNTGQSDYYLYGAIKNSSNYVNEEPDAVERELSECYDISVLDCIMDSTSNFYVGPLVHSRILNNTYSYGNFNFIYSLNKLYRTIITNNTINGKLKEYPNEEPHLGVKYPAN